MTKSLICILLIGACALPALAAQHQQNLQRVQQEGSGWMQENTGPLANEKSLDVTRFVGSVQVVNGTKSASYILRLHSAEPLEKDARKQFETFHLVVGRRTGEDFIATVGPLNLAVRAELILEIPAAESIHVATLAGKITIHGKVYHLDLQTHGGDIEIDDAEVLRAVTMGGSVIVNHRIGTSYIQTGGGDIRVDASVGELEISSLGGNISLKAIAKARVRSGGGNIEVMRCLGPLAVNTAGGNINLGEMDGPVNVESGGGNIRIGVAHGEVTVSTAMGNIELWKLARGASAHTGMGRITAEFVGDRKSMRDSELVTSMGDILVYFAGSAPANLHAVTGSSPTHHIFSDFPDLKISSGLPANGANSIAADGTIHGGGPAIEMRTMVGQIELRNVR